MEAIVAKYNYWIYALLLVVSLLAMMMKNNLLKKLIGMNIFQWSIIFYFISIGAKRGGDVPILPHGAHALVEASHYVNPLPHVLMLTAIVVGVATTGIALALLVVIYRSYGTLEEDEILRRFKE